MRIGIDFDNTIVCYDGVFHRVAAAQGLIPAHVPATKSGVRDFLRGQDREDDWTRLQGTVYGPCMAEAQPFPGVLRFLNWCSGQGWDVAVISHRTRHPYAGPKHDLHAAAESWLADKGFFARTGLCRQQTWFEETKAAKLGRIGREGCGLFIDDLPEFLREPSFPAGVRRVLFDPNDSHPGATDLIRLTRWDAAPHVLGEARA